MYALITIRRKRKRDVYLFRYSINFGVYCPKGREVEFALYVDNPVNFRFHTKRNAFLLIHPTTPSNIQKEKI